MQRELAAIVEESAGIGSYFELEKCFNDARRIVIVLNGLARAVQHVVAVFVEHTRCGWKGSHDGLDDFTYTFRT